MGHCGLIFLFLLGFVTLSFLILLDVFITERCDSDIKKEKKRCTFAKLSGCGLDLNEIIYKAMIHCLNTGHHTGTISMWYSMKQGIMSVNIIQDYIPVLYIMHGTVWYRLIW